jgi:uncharacterized protein YbcC (UPF0753/DUF2309 family)
MQSTEDKVFFDKLITNIRSKLPIQNPLHSFVHNNILQMFEGKDFHEAVEEAGTLYRARPYWPIFKYTEKFDEGKITEHDVFRGIDHYLGHYPAIPSVEKLGLTGKEYFYRLMFSELAFNDDEVQPNITNDHLWNLCREKTADLSLTLKRSKVLWRGREYWEKYHNESYALSVHPLIIRLTSSYLDQGQSFWSNPFINKSFWEFFLFDIDSMKGFTTRWRTSLLRKVETYKLMTPQEVITTELRKKGIPQEKWESYLLSILFDLKGWAGMVNKLELEPWQATVKAPQIKLVDYVASVLLIEASMDSYHSETESIDLANIHGRKENIELKSFQLALSLYQITNSFKLNERWLQRLDSQELLAIIDEVDFSENRDRVRLWHEAYENHFHREAIEAIATHAIAPPKIDQGYAQVLFCIDDREESMRRHVEEIDPMIKTYGVVGFFGIDMKFSSMKNKRLIAQCPPVISPSRIISEIAKTNAEPYAKRNISNGMSDLSLYYNSRTLFRGFLSTLILGVVSLVPMFISVFFPQQSKRFRKKFNTLINPEPDTEMSIELGEEGHGYSKLEMAKIVEAILRMCGIEKNLSELVILMAHGSSSTNNPFRQAYGCGACGGNAGIPNSRAFAKMANDKGVRAELKKLDIHVPDSTFFVSGFHDTCTDEIHFFNVSELPDKYRANFEKVKNNLEYAAKQNAFERCQRFSSFPNTSSPEEALQHVRDRAHDLAQPRPEYGHSSNALAVVGKRDLTKGLFLNRRSFLLTYDWESDPDGAILRQVVLGGVPVCVNINMDYYFSCVDNENFGCGSKLPLNLTSLLGVMTGSQSDLRIGLARQMIEIHEPIRNMTVIEAPLQKVKDLFNSHPRLHNILYHHWFRLVVKDPIQNNWWIFTQQDFEVLTFEPKKMKHFGSSMNLINETHVEEDFAEITRD